MIEKSNSYKNDGIKKIEEEPEEKRERKKEKEGSRGEPERTEGRENQMPRKLESKQSIQNRLSNLSSLLITLRNPVINEYNKSSINFKTSDKKFKSEEFQIQLSVETQNKIKEILIQQIIDEMKELKEKLNYL